jgi:hypothetical protein
MAKQKLELTWIGKDKRPKLEPRILLEDPEKSYHAKQRVTENDLFDNRLIFGDNLLALKALEQEFAGQIKCVYIDPPYNTGSALGSPPFSRTLTRRPIEAMRSVHVKASQVQCRVQAWRGGASQSARCQLRPGSP